MALVNETLAQTFYGNRNLDAIGQRFNPFFDPKAPPFTIVGVVRDVKQGGMSKKTGTELYFLNEQAPRVAGFAPGNMNVVVRSALPEEALARQIQQAVRAQDPTLPIVKLRTMDQVFSDSAARPRFLAELLGIFAGLALALAAIGTYGILSYSVTRANEGDRHPHGARRHARQRAGMVLGQGMRLTIVGLVAGPDRIVRPDAPAAGAAVQRQADRSRHAHGRGGLHRRRSRSSRATSPRSGRRASIRWSRCGNREGTKEGRGRKLR